MTGKSELFQLISVLNPNEIKSLNLSRYTDFAGIEKFCCIQSIKISASSLRYLPQQLYSFKNLKKLVADHNELMSIESLPKSLEVVDISFNEISKLYVGKLNSSTELDISHNKIVSLEGISHLVSLKFLYCNSNFISSLHVLNNLDLLEIDLADNMIKNIDLFRPIIHSIQIININNNPCCKVGNIQGYLCDFLHRGDFLFTRKNLTLSRSKLFKGFIPTKSLVISKNQPPGKLEKSFEELKEKCKVLEKKEKIEDTKTFNLQQRIKEIEMMSFED